MEGWGKSSNLTIHVYSITGPSTVTCVVSTLYQTQSNNNNNNDNDIQKIDKKPKKAEL